MVNIHTHTVNSMMKVREALHKRASPLTHGFALKKKDVVPVMHTLPALPLNLEELIYSPPIDDEESDISDVGSDCCYSDID